MAMGMFLATGAQMGWAAEKAPQKIVDLANTKLVELGIEPAIIQAVMDENAKGKTLAQIQEKDKTWKNTPGIADYMKALMESECGKYITGVLESEPYYAEIFVMDNQGANVAMTDKTSDYWQGDEGKWKNSYNGGSGGIDVGTEKLDKSTNVVLQQFSVPIVNSSGKVIGAVTFGIKTERL